jgi:predicted PurR-regulated permease PerM
MPLERHVLFWLCALALIAVVFYMLAGVLLPFIAGIVLAYLLDPVVNRLQRMGFNRLGAAALILGGFLTALVLALLFIVPLLAKQFASFVERFPETVARIQALTAEGGGSILDRLFGPIIEWFGMQGTISAEDIRRSLGNAVGQGLSWIAGLARSLITGGVTLISIVALLVITPIVAFYILLDWDDMVAAVDSWLPLRHRDTIRSLAADIDRALAGFVRGQSAVCALLGLYYGLGLTVVGLNFGFLIGFSAGILSFVPFIGALTAFVLSLCVAVAQAWPSWGLPALVVAVFAAGQVLEGYVLSPNLVGASVGLHPVFMMLAVFVFGSLFGFTGLLLAVPLAAALGVIARFALKRYLASPFYDGGAPPPSPSFET